MAKQRRKAEYIVQVQMPDDRLLWEDVITGCDDAADAIKELRKSGEPNRYRIIAVKDIVDLNSETVIKAAVTRVEP